MEKNQKLFLIGAPLFACILVAIVAFYRISIWTYEGEDKIFDILSGENFSTINSKLSKASLISSPRLFHHYCLVHGVLNKFKSGRYLIKSHSNMIAVYNTLINEKSMALLLTVPEGKNMYEIAKLVEEKHFMKENDFLLAARDHEGKLFPETYEIEPGMSAKKLVSKMLEQFEKKTAAIDLKNGPLSPDELLTLASMVEKETGDKKERPIIAGVFYNRLELKMKMQSDPTTIYGIFPQFAGRLTKKDLQTPTDYNTYTLPGLPKGPICNPGLASFDAVLHPTKHKLLYFVGKNDGTHFFSENYEDHQRAVNRWQKGH